MTNCPNCTPTDDCEFCERWICSRCEQVKSWDNGSDEPASLCDECCRALGYANASDTVTSPTCTMCQAAIADLCTAWVLRDVAQTAPPIPTLEYAASVNSQAYLQDDSRRNRFMTDVVSRLHLVCSLECWRAGKVRQHLSPESTDPQ